MYGYGGVDIGCVAVVDVRFLGWRLGIGASQLRVLNVALLVLGGLHDSDTQSFEVLFSGLEVVAAGLVRRWMRTKGFA